MNITDNLKKHISKNYFQKKLIDNFYGKLIDSVTNLNVNKILDVGCGEGFTLSMLKKKCIGKNIKGIDYSVDAINIGKNLFPDIDLCVGNIYKLPYKSNSFDLVMCLEVLEHLENPDKALEEIIRISKKYCLFSVPNEPIFKLANFFRGKNISRWGNDIEHINHWSSSDFINFVEKRRLKILIKKNPFPWTIILAEKNN